MKGSQLPTDTHRKIQGDLVQGKIADYLGEMRKNGVIEFSVRFTDEVNGIIHPMNQDGKTLDFSLEYNSDLKNHMFVKPPDQILEASERSSVADHESAKEDFYCCEVELGHLDKCKTQCPYCEKV